MILTTIVHNRVIVDPTPEQIDKAHRFASHKERTRKKSDRDLRGKYHGWFHGNLFEQVFADWMGALVKPAARDQRDNFDFIHVPWGRTLECKCQPYKMERHEPEDFLNVMYRESCGLQCCDIYIFARCNESTKQIHFCGWRSSASFEKLSTFVPKGHPFPNGKGTASYDMHCIQWYQLHDMVGLLKC